MDFRALKEKFLKLPSRKGHALLRKKQRDLAKELVARIERGVKADQIAPMVIATQQSYQFFKSTISDKNKKEKDLFEEGLEQMLKQVSRKA